MIRVRIYATGQVLEMIPNVARAMIHGGTAAEVKPGTPQPRTVAGKILRRLRTSVAEFAAPQR